MVRQGCTLSSRPHYSDLDTNAAQPLKEDDAALERDRRVPSRFEHATFSESLIKINDRLALLPFSFGQSTEVHECATAPTGLTKRPPSHGLRIM